MSGDNRQEIHCEHTEMKRIYSYGLGSLAYCIDSYDHTSVAMNHEMAVSVNSCVQPDKFLQFSIFIILQNEEVAIYMRCDGQVFYYNKYESLQFGCMRSLCWSIFCPQKAFPVTLEKL